MERDVATYSFLTWLDPFIHRRQNKHKLNNDDNFEASMVKIGESATMVDDYGSDGQALSFNDNAATTTGEGMDNEAFSESGEEEIDEEQDRDEYRGEENYEDTKKGIINTSPSTMIVVGETTKSDDPAVSSNNHNNSSFSTITSATTSAEMDHSSNEAMTIVNIVAPNVSNGHTNGEIDFEPKITSTSQSNTNTEAKNRNQSLPKINSYTSIKPSPYTYNSSGQSRYARCGANNSRFQAKNTTVRSSMKRYVDSSSKYNSPKMTKVGYQRGYPATTNLLNHNPQQSASAMDDAENSDETSLLIRLVKTKMEKLPERLKLSCQNEILQTVLKYELMAVDEKSCRAKSSTLVEPGNSTTLANHNSNTTIESSGEATESPK